MNDHQSFVNSLIGLARDYKKAEKHAASRQRPKPEFGVEVARELTDSGYFLKPDAVIFGSILQQLLESSDPRRKKK